MKLNLKMFCFFKQEKGLWLRIPSNGYGIHVSWDKNRKKLFSERNGLEKGFNIAHIRIKILDKTKV